MVLKVPVSLVVGIDHKFTKGKAKRPVTLATGLPYFVNGLRGLQEDPGYLDGEGAQGWA